ncbi:hypothetical protein D3C76_544510 [compost metagenome]
MTDVLYKHFVLMNSFLRNTSASVNADWHVSIHGHSAYNPMLITIIIDRIVLSSSVIPNDNVSYRTSPPYGILQTSHVMQLLDPFKGLALNFLQHLIKKPGHANPPVRVLCIGLVQPLNRMIGTRSAIANIFNRLCSNVG